jgi:purine-binding chemotaxis protein CheW
MIQHGVFTQSTDPFAIVSFWLGRQQYALPVEVVQEVVRLPALVQLAGAAPWLCGLLNLRGTYLPVLDGRVLVGEPPDHQLESQIVIVGHPVAQLALLVDQIEQIAIYGVESHTPLQAGIAAPLLDRVIEGESGSILLMRMAELVGLATIRREL